MQSRDLKNLCILLVSISLLQACAVALVGATIGAIDVATDRRSAGAYVDDAGLETKIKTSILTDKSLRADHVNVTSMNGIVLLTGEAPTQDTRRQVEAIARKHSEARQVVNEVRVAGKSSIGSRTNDAYLTTKVKTKLYAELKFDANRVKVITEDAHVFLLGLVKRSEGNRAAKVASKTSGVSRVIKVFEYID